MTTSGAVTYLRPASRPQHVQQGRHTSNGVDRCRAAALANGAAFTEVYEDLVEPGNDSDRPGLERAIARAMDKDKDIRWLIVPRSSTLAREPSEAQRIRDKLAEAGVRLVVVNQIPASNLMDSLIRQIHSTFYSHSRRRDIA